MAPSKTTAPKRSPASKRYHHGNLRAALVGEAMRLVEEGGAEAVNIREAARRAGVSPGAPFRHFPNRAALMEAVAEEAQRRFRAEIDKALKDCASDEPLAQFRALGIAYLRWAMRNPTHFEVISSKTLFDYDKATALLNDNAELIALMDRILEAAVARKQVKGCNVHLMRTAARALVYGFARMGLDGHFPRWGIAKKDADKTAAAVLDLFIAGLRGAS